MYVLRILMRTGAALDFHFTDIGVAQRAIDAITEKRVENGQVRMLDDAGRDFRFAAADILSEGLIDVSLETAAMVALGLAIQTAGEDAKIKAGIDLPFAPPPSPPPGALGSLLPVNAKPIARFSS